MSMTIQDQVVGAICVWRENREGGVSGMQSVFNVLMNRAAKRTTDVYTEAVRKLQFSSMTAPGDPELVLYPTNMDSQWAEALTLAYQASTGNLEDLTGGATLYYAPQGLTESEIDGTYTLPDGTIIPWVKGWNQAAVTYTCTIAKQVFFRE
jgi:hypothetical protein